MATMTVTLAASVCLVFLGRLLRVDLIQWVSNVHLPVRTSVCPQIVSLISMKFGIWVEVDEVKVMSA